MIPTFTLPNHVCGGSVINENTVVTAAHCVKGKAHWHYRVVAGAHTIADNMNKTWQIRHVKEFVVHEGYDHDESYNDIALLKMDKPFDFNDFVQPIALPANGSDPEAGRPCLSTGWGKTDNKVINPNFPAELQVVDLPIVGRDQCSTWYKTIYDVFEGEVCAGFEAGGKSPCNGDSGGPLFCSATDSNTTTLVGIVSHGHNPCGTAKLPGIFTNVGYYRQWIDEHKF